MQCRSRRIQRRPRVVLPSPLGAASAGARRRRSAMSVSDEALVDGVADASLEGAQRFFAGLPLGLLAEVVGAARGVVADLGDGGHVHGVVQLSVAARVQPVSLGRSRRGFDRSGPVVAGEVPGGREAADVTDSADDDRRGQRSDPVHLGDGRLRRLERRDVTSADLDAGGVEGADLVEQLACGGDPLDRDRPVDVHAGQEFLGSGDGQRAAGASLDEQAQQGVQPADRTGPLGGDLMVAIGQQAQHDPMLVVRRDDVQRRCAPRHDRRRAGVVGVGLVDPAPLEQPHPSRQLRVAHRPRARRRRRAAGRASPPSPSPLRRPTCAARTVSPTPTAGFADADQPRHGSCRRPSRSGRRRPPCATPCAGRSR